MEGECLDYRKLPGQNPLFLDYLYASEKVSTFYPGPPLDHHRLIRRATTVASQPRLERRVILDSLRELNAELNPSAAMEDSLETLSQPDAVAVVTGQQVGLFGGPAYSIYKALSAIKLSQLLGDSGIKAVPVFWLAGDDSDFEEVRGTSLQYRAELLEVRYPDRRTAQEQMAGSVSLEAINTSHGDILDSLTDLPFGQEIGQLLATSYSNKADFATAFGRWMRELLGDEGLLFFDPSRGAHRNHLGAFYRTAIEKREQITQDLMARGQALSAAGYVPQVHVEDSETLLFRRNGNSRFKLKWEHGRFVSKGPRAEQFTTAELLSLATDDSAGLSHGVLLRPILQDYLFPTAAYVGGPAEIAYFAQLNSIAHRWNLEPEILPRASFTLVDRHSQRFLKTHRISTEEWLAESVEAATEGVLQRSAHAGLLAQLDELERDVADRIQALRSDLEQLDRPLSDMLDRSREHVVYHLRKVRSRLVANYRRREPSLDRHLNHLSMSLRPAGVPQERKLNFNQFLAAEGIDLPVRLLEDLAPFCFSHVVVNL